MNSNFVGDGCVVFGVVRILCVSRHNVALWKFRNEIPAKHVIAIFIITNGHFSLKDVCDYKQRKKWLGINKVILIENFELKYTKNNEAVANLNIATSETWNENQRQNRVR